MPQVLSHAMPVVAAVCVLGAVSAAPPVAAQYAAGANIGVSVVPITTGAVQLSATGGVGRNMSWAAPRTLLSLGMTASAGTEAGGASLGLSTQRTAEADSLSPVFALQAAAWHSLGPITLKLGLAEHALRFTGQPGTLEISVDTEFVTDSGLVPYPGNTSPGGTAPGGGPFRVDTVRHRSTPSSVQVWSELEASAEWAVGRMRLSALVGARPPVQSFPAATWAQAGGSIDLPHGFSLDVAAGTSPARIGLGIPGSRFVSVGVRVQPVRGAPTEHIAPPAPASVLTVQPAGDHRVTFTYGAARASSVQIAGDFNAWTPVDLEEDGHGRWHATMALDPGVHHVSLRVNGGAWFAPPGVPAVPDDFGGTTGIINVP